MDETGTAFGGLYSSFRWLLWTFASCAGSKAWCITCFALLELENQPTQPSGKNRLREHF